MSGSYWLARSYWWFRGFQRAHKYRRCPRRWIWIWSTLWFLLMLTAAGITWVSWEAAMRNQSVGEIKAKVEMTKRQVWNLVYRLTWGKKPGNPRGE